MDNVLTPPPRPGALQTGEKFEGTAAATAAADAPHNMGGASAIAEDPQGGGQDPHAEDRRKAKAAKLADQLDQVPFLDPSAAFHSPFAAFPRPSRCRVVCPFHCLLLTFRCPLQSLDGTKKDDDAEVEEDNEEDGDYHRGLQAKAEKQGEKNREEFAEASDALRENLEGFKPGTYIRIEIEGAPAELIRNHDPRVPMVCGMIKPEEEVGGALSFHCPVVSFAALRCRCPFAVVSPPFHLWRRHSALSSSALSVTAGTGRS